VPCWNCMIAWGHFGFVAIILSVSFPQSLFPYSTYDWKPLCSMPPHKTHPQWTNTISPYGWARWKNRWQDCRSPIPQNQCPSTWKFVVANKNWQCSKNRNVQVPLILSQISSTKFRQVGHLLRQRMWRWGMRLQEVTTVGWVRPLLVLLKKSVRISGSWRWGCKI
jgi:hypothetical protein